MAGTPSRKASEPACSRPRSCSRSRGHKVRELAAGKLSQPGGVVVTKAGTVFVTDGIFGDGRLLKIRTH